MYRWSVDDGCIHIVILVIRVHRHHLHHCHHHRAQCKDSIIQHISIDLCDPSIPVVVSQSIRVIQTTMRKRTQRLPSSVTELQIAPAKQCRVKGVCYNWKGNKRVWDGRQLRATCAHSECNKQPAFNVEGETKALYCKAHAKEGMVDIKSKRCAHSECNKHPAFNVEGETNALYCKAHATEGMVDITHKPCAHPKCNTRPTFNVEGETKALYCKAHATEGMVDIKNKRCAHSECNKQPVFNVEGETKALYCKAHATEGMVDITHKPCAHPECNKQPVFNVEGETKALYCKAHATEGMVDIVNKRCVHPECNKQPTFNVEGETNALYCKAHATEGMVDITHKPCAHPKCNTRPTFNVEGETKALYCKAHATEGMVDIVNKRCAHPECNKQPTFNVEGETNALYCKAHATEGMVDIKSKRCASNEDGIICPISANRKYRNYCTHCFINRFPNDPLTKQIRTKSKEKIVRDYINENFEGFLHDKPLETAHCDCSLRRRIDHRKLIDGTMLAIETDEHQHRSYDPTDEEHRYDDLMCGLTCKWIYIRFNPDSYRDSHGNSHNPDLCCRLKDLYIAIQTQIDRIRNNENHDLVEIIPLYYDGWEGKDYSIPCV